MIEHKIRISLVVAMAFVFASCILGTCNTTIELDEMGLPIVDYGFVSPEGVSSETDVEGWTYVGKQRNPLTIAAQGLIYYDQYLLGNDSSKDLLINCADWLVDNAVTRNDTLVWEYNYGWPTYNITPNFISGMSQSGAIRVLAIAHNLTGEDRYIQGAKRGLEVFYLEVDKGGVTYKDADGWWYEEYAQPGLDIEPRVLNGHMAVLIDLYEYYNLTKDGSAKELFDLGLGDLKANLDSYDTGSWSRYDLVGNNAVKKYHEFHISQLQALYNITGDALFKTYRDSWLYYELAYLHEYMAEIEKDIVKLRSYQSGLVKEISDIETRLSDGVSNSEAID